MRVAVVVPFLTKTDGQKGYYGNEFLGFAWDRKKMRYGFRVWFWGQKRYLRLRGIAKKWSLFL